MLVNVGWLHGGQVASDVASVVTLMDGWAVESMVVTWGEVDDHVVKLVALSINSVDESLDLRVVLAASDLGCEVGFIHGITDEAAHELIKTVGAALDTVDGAVTGADLADGKDAAVTGGADRCSVFLVCNDTCSGLEGSREEVGEGGVLLKSIADSLIDLDSVDMGEETEHGASEAGQDVELADVASEARLQASDRDEKAEVLKLLEDLVEEDDVEETVRVSDKFHHPGHHRHPDRIFHETGRQGHIRR